MFSLLLLAGAALAAPADKDKPGLVELFEDDDEALVKGLTQENNGSVAKREGKDVYSGQRSLCVTPMQRFNPQMPGWNYPIVEKPGPGQYRYLRFAWKKVDGQQMMIQLCGGPSPTQDWGHRYVAGANLGGWKPDIILASKPPAVWKVVTRDLYKDFGAFTLSGIAFTPYDGTAGLFDHIYLARSLEDFDQIDAIGRNPEAVKDDLPAARLQTLWDNLADEDDARALRAQRALFAAARQGVPLLKERLKPVDYGDEEKRILPLIADLDDDDIDVREKASAELAKAGHAAVRALRKARENPASVEARRRLDALLKNAADDAPPPEQLRLLRAVELLERVGTPEAGEVLQALAKGTAGAEPTEAARAAVERLAKKKG
jgi:hypothetical protein